MSVDDELMREFLLESSENLNQLDRDFVALEQDPTDRARLGGIFRCIHTIKGTSGFLDLPKLEGLTHTGETLLSRLRDGELALDERMASALLSMVDAVRRILTSVETNGVEGDEDFTSIVEQLASVAVAAPAAAAPSVAVPAPVAVAAPPPPVAAPSVAAPAPVAAIAPPPPPPVVAPVPVAVVAPPPPVAAPAPVAAVAPPPPIVVHLAAPAAMRAPSAPPLALVRPSPYALPSSPPPATVEEPPAAAKGALSDSTIRVDVDLLDRVMNLVGELVLARNQIIQFGTTVDDASFANAAQRLNLLTTELQEGVMKTRMQPIGNVWNKFPRVVRDLAHACGKKVNLELDGIETELDRTIIEAIKDPLTHAVRNAVDHGFENSDVRLAAGKPEAGRLLLRAFHEGGQVNIEVSDDGKGLDVTRIRARAVERGIVSAERAARMSERELTHLIFQPGFSTAEKVTNVSGRGVGMDVVKTNIEKIGGTVDISSRLGHGTTLKIKIPLTLAIIPALIITSRSERFAIPQVNLLELVRLEGEAGKKSIERLHGTTVYRLRGNLLPLVFLDRALELSAEASTSDVLNIVVLQADDRQFGLVVDGISDTEEIVVKPLGKELKGISVFAGATIMGDGRVALILDVLGIAQRSNVVSAASRERGMGGSVAVKEAELRETLLLFRVGRTGRMAIPLSMVARLEEIGRSDVEHAGGRDVVQYRGAILPLIDLGREISGEPYDADGEAPLQVIVYSEHGRSVGFVVDQILDIVEEHITVRHRSARQGALGSVVLAGKVTDLLDVHGVMNASDPGFYAQEEAA